MGSGASDAAGRLLSLDIDLYFSKNKFNRGQYELCGLAQEHLEHDQ